MKTHVLLFPLAITFLLVAFAPSGGAQVPALVNYQGKLLDSQGIPVTGNVTVSLAIFDAETGGNPLYSESVGSVQVERGIYSFAFGAGTPGLSEALAAASQHWLALSIDGVAQEPRQRILAVPFALHAQKAVQSATVVDGAITTSKLATGAVQTANIASGAITSEKLAPGTVQVGIRPKSVLVNYFTMIQSEAGYTGTPEIWLPLNRSYFSSQLLKGRSQIQYPFKTLTRLSAVMELQGTGPATVRLIRDNNDIVATAQLVGPAPMREVFANLTEVIDLSQHSYFIEFQVGPPNTVGGSHRLILHSVTLTGTAVD